MQITTMSEIRERIISEQLDEKFVDPDPIKQFQRWFDDAIADGLKLPEAMTLATATSAGKPCSAKVGMSGKSGTRLRDVIASGRTFPPTMVPAAEVSAVEVTAMCPP